MKKIELSIIIPVYNSEKYIATTIESILSQSNESIELILVNDGSKDNSISIMKTYSERPNVIILEQENSGAPMARNNGLKYAKGNYVMFFDSDDVLNQNSISKILNLIQNNEPDIIIADYEVVSADLKRIREIRHLDIKKDNLFDMMCLTPYPGNKIYKKDIIEKNQLVFDSVKIGQDLNFYLKFIIDANRIEFLNFSITKYRILNNSISRSIDSRILDIIKSFDYVESYYKSKNVDQSINEILHLIEIEHYVAQIGKIRNEENKILKRNIYESLSFEIKKTFHKVHVQNYSQIKFIFFQYLSYVKTKYIIKFNK